MSILSQKSQTYLFYIQKVTDYLSHNYPEFKEFSEYLEKINNKTIELNDNLNDDEKKFLENLESYPNKKFKYSDLLDKINSNKPKMKLIKELVGTGVLIKRVNKEAYCHWGMEKLDEENEYLSIPFKTSKYYKHKNQEESKKILKEMSKQFQVLEIPEDVDTWYEKMNKEIKEIVNNLQNPVRNEEYLNILELINRKLENNEGYEPDFMSSHFLSEKNKSFYSIPVFKIMKENDIEIDFNISEVQKIREDTSEYTSVNGYFANLNIDVDSVIKKIKDHKIENLNLPIQKYLDNLKFISPENQKILDEKEKIEKDKEFERKLSNQAEEDKSESLKEILKEIHDKKNKIELTDNDNIGKLIELLENNENNENNEIEKYILVQKEYDRNTYPVWLIVNKISDDKIDCSVTEIGNDINIVNKSTGEVDKINNILEEMYPFGIYINKSEVLITANEPINLDKLHEKLVKQKEENAKIKKEQEEKLKKSLKY